MKHAILKHLVKGFLCLSLIVLVSACSKKDENTKPEEQTSGANMTANLVLGSGETIDFSYTNELMSSIVLVGPDEETGLYTMLMSGGDVYNENRYKLFFTGLIQDGKGTYQPMEGDDEPMANLVIFVSTNNGESMIQYLPGEDRAFDFRVTKFTDNYIEGEFSGKLFSFPGLQDSIIIENGHFHFNNITILKDTSELDDVEIPGGGSTPQWEKTGTMSAHFSLGNGAAWDYADTTYSINPVAYVSNLGSAEGKYSMAMSFSDIQDGKKYNLNVRALNITKGIGTYTFNKNDDPPAALMIMGVEDEVSGVLIGSYSTIAATTNATKYGDCTVTITKLTDDEIAGTFSGKVYYYDLEKDVLDSISVSNGQFQGEVFWSIF